MATLAWLLSLQKTRFSLAYRCGISIAVEKARHE
jgi:hypothetical protein